MGKRELVASWQQVNPDESEPDYDEDGTQYANVLIEPRVGTWRLQIAAGLTVTLVAGLTGGFAVGVEAEKSVNNSRSGRSANLTSTPRIEPDTTITPTITPESAPSISPTAIPSNNSEIDKLNDSKFKIAQSMIVGFDARTPKSTIDEVVADTHIGGIYLTYTSNAVAAGFTPAYYAHLSKLAGAPMLVASDEEGGMVHRETYSFDFPSAKQMGTKTTVQVQAIGAQVGKAMRSDGVTIDLGPVLDIDNGKNDGAISKLNRSFGGPPTNIANKAGAFAAGLEQNGVTPVFKHFPGLGRAMPNSDTDSHKAMAPHLSSLEKSDILPYKRMIDAHSIPAIMLSNEYVPGLDANNPASISPASIKLLRQSLGFKGLITTDSLEALSGYDGKNLTANIVDSVKAGVDAPLFNFTDIASIKAAVNEIARDVSTQQISSSYNRVKAVSDK